MIRWLKVLTPVLVLGLGIYVTWLLIATNPPLETRPPEILPPLVRTLSVQAEVVQLMVHSQGSVVARTESALVAEVSGRVTEVSPSLAAGGFFEAGQVLLRIDPSDFELALVQGRAEVARTEHRLEIERAQAEVARQEWDSLGGGGRPTPLLLREPQLKEAQAALEAAQANLARAELDLARTSVSAPFAGRVQSKRVDLGQFVIRGAELARIYAVDYAEIRLPIPDEDLAFLNLPMSYRDLTDVSSTPSVSLTVRQAGRLHVWRGRVVRTEGMIDPQTRMITAVARVENPYGRGAAGRPPLRVGQFVQAEISGRRSAGIVRLPREALRGPDRVFVVDEQDRLRFREVRVLRRQGEEVLVEDGLQDGERVCLSPLDSPVEGMIVRVLPAPGDLNPGPAPPDAERLGAASRGGGS